MSNEDESQNTEPKIVVDDDWKEQVAKEKGALDQSGSPSEAKEPATDCESGSCGCDQVSSDQVSLDQANVDEMPAPPPASFEMLITMMFTQAMSMLGQIPDPATGKSQVNKPFAKHYIDSLEMIGEKTQGNLTSDETKMHGEALHALRMAYVSTKVG